MTLRPEEIRQNVLRLMPEVKRLLLAVSGGPDSVALVRLLVGQGFELELAHFDHQLRPESPEDAKFVKDLAAALSLPCHTGQTDVAAIAKGKGWNLEDGARRLRYAFLTRTAKKIGAEATVTGHTLDDQAETVLMQLLRGAAYLKGMPAQQGKVIRPLLETPHDKLLEFLGEQGQTFRHDPTNTEPTRTRAWLRGVLLPQLEQRYPAIKQLLARLASLQQDQAAHFDNLSRPFIQDDAIVVGELARQDLAIKRHTVATLLKDAGVPHDLAHIQTLVDQLEATSPFRLSLTDQCQAQIAYGRLSVAETRTPTVTDPPRVLPKDVDQDALKSFSGVHYRKRAPGDRIHMPGGSKKVSDLLINRKIPREIRDQLWVLASGQNALWIEGVATDVRVATKAVDEDIRFMRDAQAQARLAFDANELPVGAVVVHAGQVIGAGHNTTERDHEPTAHAEMHALRQAARALGDWRLTGCTLYVTLEPCPMCFGAALSSHLSRLVFGAKNDREGALGGVSDLQQHPWKRRLEVRGDLLAGEGRELLSAFFSKRRS